MSVEGWEGVQRHGQDIVDRVVGTAQDLGVHVLSHLDSQKWPWNNNTSDNKGTKGIDRVHFGKKKNQQQRSSSSSPFPFPFPSSEMHASSILQLGKKLGDAGADFGARVGEVFNNILHSLPLPDFGHPQSLFPPLRISYKPEVSATVSHSQQLQSSSSQKDSDDEEEEDERSGDSGLPKVNVTVSTSYDSQLQNIESSVVASGSLWRAEVSSGGLSSVNSTPMFMLQLGPILLFRNTTILMPVHLSKQHMLWYGYDRKNGLHSLCPVISSKSRKWLCMSMFCLNPLSCAFWDLQFPNGQFRFMAGEGLTSSIFVPAFGGLLQCKGHYPGETKLSFSRKMRWGMKLTPILNLPDKTMSIGIEQPLYFQRSGVIIQPAVSLSVTSTFSGRDAGWLAEISRTVSEKLSVSCGCVSTINPSAFASVSLGKSKCPGSSALKFRIETPLDENIGKLSVSVNLSTSVEF